MKITVCAYLKNAYKLKNPSYYARVKVDGKTHDIALHTTEKAVAESWVRLRKSEIQRYNDYIACGEVPPEDLLAKLMPTIAQKGTSEAVSLIPKCLDGWEADLRQKGYRERSIDTYCKAIRNTVPSSATTADFTSKRVNEWLNKPTLKTSTRKSYSVSLREFAKFLIANYGVSRSVMDNWPMVKVQTEERGYLTMPQMYKLIEAIQCQSPDMEQQMKAYCWIMATCGSRQQETYLLRWSDFVDGVITFRSETTKGNKTRRVPLDMRVAEMLLRLPKKSPDMFPDLPKSQAGRFSIVARAARKAGIGHAGLHLFRHSACMYLYAHCKDVKAIGQMVGHSPAVSLQYYVASRESDELRSLVQTAYASEVMIPNAMDELIKAGLI
jgi:integrase